MKKLIVSIALLGLISNATAQEKNIDRSDHYRQINGLATEEKQRKCYHY
jgi:hypothetical protein